MIKRILFIIILSVFKLNTYAQLLPTIGLMNIPADNTPFVLFHGT